MRKLGRRQLARHIVRLLREQPQNRANIVRMVAGYLVATKRANQAHLLMQDVADEFYIANKHLSADVYQAFPTTQEVTQAVTSLLQSATGATTVELRQHTTPDIIGGIIVRTPRLELDASIKTQLKQIAGGIK